MEVEEGVLLVLNYDYNIPLLTDKLECYKCLHGIKSYTKAQPVEVEFQPVEVTFNLDWLFHQSLTYIKTVNLFEIIVFFQ